MVGRGVAVVAASLLVSVAAGGCHGTQPALVRANVASDGLLLLGLPCSADGDCNSAFCVDGVCCNSACGGGVRDLQACSTIYGQVPGLVDGTCTTLTSGDPCGALTSVNPCTWRGSTINGGGQCPNPPGTSVACFPCSSSADCSGAYPVCSSGACLPCDGDYGSGTPAACPSTAPTCSTGQCIGCSGCTGTTPVCDMLASTCSPCNGDYDSGATLACPTPAAPACLATGACGQCSASNTATCSGTTPACDITTFTCAGCNGDYGSGASLPCPTQGNPVCLNTSACGRCTSNADCGAGTACNTALGSCGAICAADPACPSGQWCAGGICAPQVPNGGPLPTAGGIGGTCTSTSGARVCVSGVCDTADNACGLENGSDCGPPPNDAQCRSGVCAPSDNQCGVPVSQPCTISSQCRTGVCAPSSTCGDCQADTDCGAKDSGVICDQTDYLCKPGCRGAGGNTCGSGRVCTSTDSRAGKCVGCLSDAACGDATSGQVCDETHECRPGCRGSGGNGCAAGAVCTSGDGSIGQCYVAEGGGPSCAASPLRDGTGGFSLSLLLLSLAAGVLSRRRR